LPHEAIKSKLNG
jgi:Leucine-rich repeat (LRR) protein